GSRRRLYEHALERLSSDEGAAELGVVTLPGVGLVDIGQCPGKYLLHFPQVLRRDGFFQKFVDAHLGRQMARRALPLEFDTDASGDPGADHAGKFLRYQKGREIEDQEGNDIVVKGFGTQDDAA